NRGGSSVAYGIYVYYHSNGIVTNNYIKNLSSTTTAEGIYVYNSSSNITNALIANNIIQNLSNSSNTKGVAGIDRYRSVLRDSIEIV
ncbi:MAG TPA: hypothetical protein PLV01_05140, partial [Candidatus Kapabacteria bacterium]|nr:hypothetical protein [Candidatus Kapabacteria bacterium]